MLQFGLIFLIIYIIYVNSFNINNNKKINMINFDDNKLMNRLFKNYTIKNTIHYNYIYNLKINKLIHYLDKYNDKLAVKLFYYRYDLNDNLKIIRNYNKLSELTSCDNDLIRLKLNNVFYFLKSKLEADEDL